MLNEFGSVDVLVVLIYCKGNGIIRNGKGKVGIFQQPVTIYAMLPS